MRRSWHVRALAPPLPLLLGLFVLSRLLLLALSRQRGLYPYTDDPFELTVFSGWASAFAGRGGEVPLRDGPWEYPAGAALIVAGPALLPASLYVVGFVAHMVLWDLVVLLLLVGAGRRYGSLTGAWLWLAVVPLLGPVALTRFDVVPTALAVGGLAVAGVAPLVAGVLLGSGAVVKLWPALVLLLVLGLHRARGRVLAGALVIGLATLVAVTAYGGADQLLSFLGYQRARGLEIESLPALPLMLARACGASGIEVFFGFGSNQVRGAGAERLLVLSDLGLPLVAIAVGVLALRADRRDAPADQAAVLLAALLMAGVLVVDKVLSPQYPLWLAGLVCLALCWPRSPLRAAVLPLAAALLLTQLVYPLRFRSLVETTALGPVLLLAVRDALVLGVLVISARACWRLEPAGSSDPGALRTAGSR